MGVIKADVVYKGKMLPGKTFYPAEWTRTKLVEKTVEALKNPIKKIELGRDGKWALQGLTSEGITIDFYITQKGSIKTFYPKINGSI